MVMTTQERRLRELRAGDTIGLYAKDGPTTGREPRERLSVTINETNDVTSVLVEDLSADLRSPAALQTALDLAYRAAIAHKLAHPAAQAVLGPAPRRRPAVAPVVRRTLPPLTERPMPTPSAADAHATRDRQPVRDFAATGHSRNECVSLRLSPGTPTGTLDLDLGWLRRATETTLSNAITEAFASAYQERDRS